MSRDYKWVETTDPETSMCRLQKHCAVCGAPAGEPCTKECDDDSVPDDQVKAHALTADIEFDLFRGKADFGPCPEALLGPCVLGHDLKLDANGTCALPDWNEADFFKSMKEIAAVLGQIRAVSPMPMYYGLPDLGALRQAICGINQMSSGISMSSRVADEPDALMCAMLNTLGPNDLVPASFFPNGHRFPHRFDINSRIVCKDCGLTITSYAANTGFRPTACSVQVNTMPDADGHIFGVVGDLSSACVNCGRKQTLVSHMMNAAYGTKNPKCPGPVSPGSMRIVDPFTGSVLGEAKLTRGRGTCDGPEPVKCECGSKEPQGNASHYRWCPWSKP